VSRLECEPLPTGSIDAIVFDLDGVLVESEGVWNAARRDIALRNGGQWPPDAQRAMMGMSSTEWSAYMHDELGVTMSPAEISDTVVARLAALYRQKLPLIEGAREAVVELASAWPLALASSANRPIIELVLELARLKDCFVASVASEEVAHGKPAPDVYLEAARRIGVPPPRCAAVEDSSNGMRSAAAAGMRVLAVPNREFPPTADALALAVDVVHSVAELTPERVRRMGAQASSS
jgi:HAD superfamily hydrolase (TIGR01509 family)